MKYPFLIIIILFIPAFLFAQRPGDRGGYGNNDNIRNSNLTIAPNETHDYPIENSKAFNQTVIEFLKK